MHTPRKTPVSFATTYEGLGELSPEEVEAILASRNDPGLGILSNSERLIVVKMRGGILKNEEPRSIEELQKAIVKILRDFEKPLHEIHAILKNANYLYELETLEQAIYNLEQQGKIKLGTLPEDYGSSASWSLTNEQK